MAQRLSQHDCAVAIVDIDENGLKETGDFDVAPLLTGTVPLDGIADAFERLRSNPHDAKILLDPTLTK